MSRAERLGMLERDSRELSVRTQCELLGLNRSSLYYQAVPVRIVIVPVVGVVLLFWGALIAYTWIRTRRMSTGKLNTITGPVKLVGKPMQAVGGKVYQRIKIGKRDFYVSNTQARTLTPGAAYAVYFVGSGQMAQIISVEPSASMAKA